MEENENKAGFILKGWGESSIGCRNSSYRLFLSLPKACYSSVFAITLTKILIYPFCLTLRAINPRFRGTKLTRMYTKSIWHTWAEFKKGTGCFVKLYDTKFDHFQIFTNTYYHIVLINRSHQWETLLLSTSNT